MRISEDMDDHANGIKTRGVQDGGHMYTHGRLMWMYGKNHCNTVISLQLKQNKQKKNVAEVLLCYLKSLEFTL